MADKKGILYNEAAKAYFYGDCVSSIEPYGGGHINDTFLARTEKGNFVLQRVNGYVFPHPDEIMDNMVHVTKFLAEKLEKAGKDPKRGTLTVLKTNDGKDYYIDSEGNYWRSTINLENTTAYDFAESPEMLKKSGAAFGAHVCFYCDVTVFTSGMTKIDNIEHAVTQLPYGLIGMAVSCAGYLLAGFLLR